jgi:polyisoprenoid-binding protein YceI
MRALLMTCAGLALAAAATAQMPTEKPGARDPSRVTGGTYEVDPNHTLVGWRLDHLGFSDYFGLFGNVTGTLTIDPANLSAAKVDVTIPIVPVVASQGLHDHLLRPGKDGAAPDFFGPTPQAAHFVSTSVAPSVDRLGAYIVGDLTLNGHTRPVAIQASFTGAGSMMGSEQVGFSGRALIKRSDFGLTTGIPLVSDEVELDLTAAFQKKAAGEPQPRPAPAVNACNGDKVKPWFGKKATPAVRAEVAAATGAKSIRWLYPDSIVTQDFRADRLNVRMDKGTDEIRSASCG